MNLLDRKSEGTAKVVQGPAHRPLSILFIPLNEHPISGYLAQRATNATKERSFLPLTDRPFAPAFRVPSPYLEEREKGAPGQKHRKRRAPLSQEPRLNLAC